MAVPSSKVWHKISFSTGGKASPLSSYYKTRNGLIMISKNYSSNIKFWSYVCFKYIKALSGVAVSMLLRKNLTRNLYILRGLNDFRRGVVGMFRSGSFRSDAREASKTN